MKRANGYFVSGVFCAVLAISVFTGNGFFSGVMATDGRGRLARELRLGNEIGIVESQDLLSKKLDRSINRNDFAEKLSTIMDLLGGNEVASPKGLSESGILSNRNGRSSVKRADAIEAFARTVIYLNEKGMISLPEATAKNYRDYRVPQKFSRAIAYLQSKFVLRGYPDGTAGAKKVLSNREAVFFLYRLYEAIASDMMSKRTNEGISFIDIPLSHPLMQAIANLTRAGAFDKVMLRPSFDGESFISVSDLTEMLTGIFSKGQRDIDQIRIRTIFSDNANQSEATRKQLVLALEYVLETFAKDRLNAAKISYSDVSIEQPEFEALIKLAGCGITMGQNGRFTGSSSLSWYETVKVMDRVLDFAEITPSTSTSQTKLAEKTDVENFKTLIRAKRERIRKILNRGN